MEYFLVFVAGMAASLLILRWAINRAINRILGQMVPESSEEDQFKLRVELVENQLLCYNNSTMAFICQGASLKEVLDNFNKQFPGRDVTLISEDDELIKNLTKQKQLLDV
jgi:pheromone shutdown protein TraB